MTIFDFVMYGFQVHCNFEPFLGKIGQRNHMYSSRATTVLEVMGVVIPLEARKHQMSREVDIFLEKADIVPRSVGELLGVSGRSVTVSP